IREMVRGPKVSGHLLLYSSSCGRGARTASDSLNAQNVLSPSEDAQHGFELRKVADVDNQIPDRCPVRQRPDIGLLDIYFQLAEYPRQIVQQADAVDRLPSQPDRVLLVSLVPPGNVDDPVPL